MVRRDASRNREAILDAARELLAGPDELRLSAVAQRAGVGQGTIYRHFADRDELLGALYLQELDELVELADALRATHSPDVALRSWLERLAAYARVKRGVMGVVAASAWSEVSASTMGRLGSALTPLLTEGAGAGLLRDDIDARDVILMSWFLAHVDEDEWADRVPRLLDVLLAGLRA